MYEDVSLAEVCWERTREQNFRMARYRLSWALALRSKLVIMLDTGAGGYGLGCIVGRYITVRFSRPAREDLFWAEER